MPARPARLIDIIRGEPYELILTLRDKATGAALEPWPGSIRLVIDAAGGPVDLLAESAPPEVAFTLDATETAALKAGVFGGGLEVDGRTWVELRFNVRRDRTPAAAP